MPPAVIGMLAPYFAAAAAVGTIASVINRPKPGTPANEMAPPKVEAPLTMPGPNDQAVQDAKRRSVMAQMARQGRASTILTGDNGTSGTAGDQPLGA